MLPETEKKIREMATMYAEHQECRLREVAAAFGHDPSIITRWTKTKPWLEVMQAYGYTTAKKPKQLRLSLEELKASKRSVIAHGGSISKAARSLSISEQGLRYRTRLPIWKSL